MKRIAILAVATLALAAPAFARRPAGAYQVGNDSFHLFYEDLDTSTIAGRAELLKRVGTVAHRLCTTALKVEEDECVRATIAGLDRPEIVQALAEQNTRQLAAR